MAAFDEANKEYNLVRSLGDLYVGLLRCSRSPDLHYRQEAAQGLLALLRTLALRSKTPIADAVEAASKRVGWEEEPEDESWVSIPDRYRIGEMLEQMLSRGYNLGDEPSGHIILSDYAT
jgi:hypothetical protein